MAGYGLVMNAPLAHPPDPVAPGTGGGAVDGVLIRRVRPTDHDRLRQFYAGLADETRRTRFLGSASGIGDRQSNYFCCPDHAHREGFVAVTRRGGDPGRIVGHVCVEPDGPATAEVAVAVADGMQGHGLGRRLVATAVRWARFDGLTTLTATMLAANPAIQRLLTSLDFPTVARPVGAGLIEVRIDLRADRPAA